MFSPTKTGIIWDSTDAHNLTQFLQSATGEKLLHILHFRIPSLLDGEHKNKTLVRSGEVKGALLLFDSVVSLTHEPPPEFRPQQTTVQTYPDIDDESQWEGDQPRTAKPPQ